MKSYDFLSFFTARRSFTLLFSFSEPFFYRPLICGYSNYIFSQLWSSKEDWRNLKIDSFHSRIFRGIHRLPGRNKTESLREVIKRGERKRRKFYIKKRCKKLYTHLSGCSKMHNIYPSFRSMPRLQFQVEV